MTQSSRTKLLAFAGLGVASSLVSTYVHYRLVNNPGFTSFCDVNTTVSCTEAYQSQYGSFWGYPVAVLGAYFFTVCLALAGWGGRKDSKTAENVPAYIFALSTIGLAFVLYLAYASFFVLKALCILCAITYVAVIGLFIVSGGATTFPMTQLPARALRDVRTAATSPVALVLAVLLVIGAVAVPPAFHHDAAATAAAQESNLPPLTPDELARVAQWWDLQPKVDVPIPADGAKVLMVKFNDFQCPPCRQTYYLYQSIIDKYTKTGQFKFVLKHFPLEPECNPQGAPNGPHVAACEAAAADVMARAKNDGSAEKLEAWLFSNQGPPLLEPSQVKEAARVQAGIADFDAKYASTLVQVKNDAGMGVLLGVKSTPTFFINGRMLAGGQDPRLIDALIDLELKRAK
jgi:uncharacterized membrane protein/protein-disulfide isomerase